MVGKDAIAPEHIAVADWDQPNGADAMEEALTQRQPVGVGRRWTFVLYFHITRIVHVTAETRVRFEFSSVGQIHRLGTNVVDGGSVLAIRR